MTIDWTEGEYGTLKGKSGGITLFVISFRTVSSDPAYLMQTTLPGFRSTARWKSNDRAALESKANEVLTGWLTRIGTPGEAGSAS